MSWKRPFFALIALLLFFVFLDGLLWAFGVETLLAERDPFLGFSDAVRVFEEVPERGVYRTPPRAVAHSFNYQEFLAHKPEAGFRLFTLGGSSAYGFPWDARIAFTAVLGQALQAAMPERPVEAINVAAMSYGSHRLRILAEELLDYEPDLLVIYTGHNEFVERRFYRDHLERSPELDRFRRLLYRWRLYSVLMRVKESGTRDAREPAVQDPDLPGGSPGGLLGLDVVREYSVDVSDDERQEVRRHFEGNLTAIVEMANARGVAVLLCTVPSNLSGWRPNQSLFGNDVDSAARARVLELLDSARPKIEAGEIVQAVEQLERARSLAPKYAEIHFELGKAYAASGRADDAWEAFVLARDLDAQPARAVTDINNAVRKLGHGEDVLLVDVEDTFRAASPDGLLGFNLFEDYVHPKPEAHRLIALELWTLLLEEGLLGEPRRASAEEFWEQVGESGPPVIGHAEGPDAATDAKTPAQLFNLGVVLEHQGLNDQAIEKYRACLELNPSYHVARSNMARLLRDRGRLQEAVVEYEQALDTEPRHVKSMIGLGETLRRMDRFDEALLVLERATRTDPGSVTAFKTLGLTLLNLQRYADAELPYRKATQLAPRDADAWVDLGFALFFQNRIDDAETAFRAALDARPDPLRGRNGLAAVFTERGQLDEAERLFRENLLADPTDDFAQGGLQEIEKRRGAIR
jgi:tetratricopeptide (TPR) repeat protein